MLFVVAEVESAAFETSNFAALSRLGRDRAGNPLHAVHFATDGGAHGVTRPTQSVVLSREGNGSSLGLFFEPDPVNLQGSTRGVCN